jgi:hypothetical protein
MNKIDQRAIKHMEKAKESHVLWAKILDKKVERPKWARHESVDRLVGDARYHRMWVRRYTHVLKILKGER